MPDLVAIALPPGPEFVRELLATWESGNAVLPIDVRWPGQLRDQVVDQFGATTVIGAEGTRQAEGFEVEAGDALVMATSGTSGFPKGVVLTHDALQAAATMTSEALEVDPATDSWLACLPFAHIGGLGVFIRAHLTGTPLRILPQFEAAAVEAEAAAGATLVSLVPTALQRIEPASFRTILLGGAQMPAERPANTVATYGLTESGGGVVYDGQPLAGVDVKVVNGVVHLRSPTMARAYRNGDPVTDDGWLNTGDLGRFDDKLEITGRLDDMITTGGETVSPEPIEARLREHPQVGDVAVIGLSMKNGERS